MFDILYTIFKYKERSSPDKLGLFPERVHIAAMPERRYLWTSRILVILASIFICINMMLASTIYVLLPQKFSVPKLFFINKYFSQLEQVQPSELNFPASDLVAEQHIYEYIILRYTITSDYDEARLRWAVGSKVYWYSSPNVYKEFKDTDIENNILQFRTQGLTRATEIDWIKPLARNVWLTQFRTLDYTANKPDPLVNIWRATLRITYANLGMDKDEAIKNPFGFLITGFSLAYHGRPDTSEHYLQTAKQISETLNRGK